MTLDPGKRPVLASKLRPPRMRQVLTRRRLIDFASPGADFRLTNICAGAGFGKTTLMAQIAEAFDGNRVWYQMDGLDRDPTSFLRHLIAGTIHSEAMDGSRTLSRMDDSDGSPGEAENILAVMLDEVRERNSTRLLLCFDDLHLLSENDAAMNLLDFLIQNLPDHVGVALASRTSSNLSLGRLRSRGQLCELGESDLQFSFEEISNLVDEWDIEATDAALRKVYKSTEGWAAGIVLTESYIRSGADAPELFEHRKMQQNVYEYLAEEVMHNQAPEMRDFLLRAALIDPIDPAICQKALGVRDPGDLLEKAEKRNIFTARLDEADLYRYHPLFRDFLLSRLQVEASDKHVAELRVNFARAFTGAGNDRAAIEQFILAGSDDDAVELIEKVGDELLNNAEHETLDLWIGSLAEDSLTPLLRNFQAAMLISRGKFRQALRILRAVDQKLPADDLEIICRTKLAIVECLGEMREVEQGIQVLEPFLDEPLDPMTRLHVLFRLSVCHWIIFNHDGLTNCIKLAKEVSCDEAASIIQGCNYMLALQNLRQGRFPEALKFFNKYFEDDAFNESQKNMYMNNLASSLMLVGEYGKARIYAEKCLERIEKQKEDKTLPITLDTLGCLMIAEGEHDRGELLLKRVLSESSNIEQNRTDQDAATFCHLGTLARRQGEYDRALNCHQKSVAIALPLEELYEVAMSTANIGADLVRVFMFEEAEKQFEDAEKLAFEHSLGYVLTVIDFSRAWSAYLQGDKNEAAKNISSALKRARNFQHNHFVIQESKATLPILGLALERGIEADYVCWVLKRIGSDSLSVIEPSLQHEEAFVRGKIAALLADINSTGALTLLRRMRHDKDERVRETVHEALSKLRQNLASPTDVLTPRETEVLKWLAKGKANGQIATELFISERTVKTHVARIFQKLGFTNRIDAALYYQKQCEKNTTSDE